MKEIFRVTKNGDDINIKVEETTEKEMVACLASLINALRQNGVSDSGLFTAFMVGVSDDIEPEK